MKKIPYIIILVFSFALFSCEGPSGPPGPVGPPGQPGAIFVAQSFERTVDFFPPNYRVDFEIPLDIELFESDMVLVYHLVGVDSDGFDIWRILPDTVYTATGDEFQYNFEHNFDFIDVFIEAPSTFDFDTLLPGDTLGQIFRVVILPVDFIDSNNIDVTNFWEVMEFVE